MNIQKEHDAQIAELKQSVADERDTTRFLEE